MLLVTLGWAGQEASGIFPMSATEPLLITATFEVANTPDVRLRDSRERLVRHMEGVLAWLGDPFFSEIVLAKNCTLPVKVDPLKKVAEVHGKRLEFVQVEPSPLTQVRGKGFGEGEMIRQALRKSELLGRACGFCKATGKLFLRDAGGFYARQGRAVFFKCSAPRCGALVFWRSMLGGFYRSQGLHRVLPWLHRHARVPWSLVAAAPREWIDTRFYRVSKELYLERFLGSYERVDDALGYSLEAAFADDAAGLSDCALVKSEPIVLGYSGTHGTAAAEFPEDIRRQARELADRML